MLKDELVNLIVDGVAFKQHLVKIGRKTSGAGHKFTSGIEMAGREMRLAQRPAALLPE